MLYPNGDYYEKIRVEYDECDFMGRPKLSAVLKRFSDIASNDYDRMGFSHDFLFEHGFVYLLTRISVKVSGMSSAGREAELATYERGAKGVQVFRDYYITAGGETLLTGKTAWVICDPTSRKILKPETCIKPTPVNFGHEPDCPEPKRIRLPENPEYAGKRRVVYSDLDANGHVFNAVYADIACDFLPFELLSHNISEFFIDFSREAKIGNELEIYRSIEGDTAVVVGMLDGLPSFETEFHFSGAEEKA
mgnify:CR=1 FL=1